MLNSQQIVDQKIISNLLFPEKQVQQVGVDLTIDSIYQLENITPGVVFNDYKATSKTVLSDNSQITPVQQVVENTKGESQTFYGWHLSPGVYAIDMNEGCNIPANVMIRLIQRSSLMRNGALIVSSVFDPGFETERIGTMLFVHKSIYIEKNARVCQAIAFNLSEAVQDDLLYGKHESSQFQNDSQRKK